MDTPFQIIEIGAGENQQIKVYNYTRQRISPEHSQSIAEQAGPFMPIFEKDYLAEFYVFEFANGIIAGHGCLMTVETPISVSAEFIALINDINVIFGQCLAKTIAMMNELLDLEDYLERSEDTMADESGSYPSTEESETDSDTRKEFIISKQNPLPGYFNVEQLIDEMRKDGDKPDQ